MNVKVFAIVSAVVLTVGILATTSLMQPTIAKDNPTKDNPTKDNPTLIPGNATNSTSGLTGIGPDLCPATDPQPANVEICRTFDK